ncbi:hypothetical protein CDD82_3979 [Ophiocordyceps australis]|uniref:PA14 domain-containing protein n=1 Tax=Ophiocordyceps australis TaxID=1399860 RepID=A0A2C5ZAL0_9HYPO|nr:hypothetical protein CDD82_3979 [Ophiocordyceps australis]
MYVLLYILVAASLASSNPTTTLTIPCVRPDPTTTQLPPCGLGRITIIVETPLPTANCHTPAPLPFPSPVPGGPCVVSPTCPASGLNIDYYSNPFGGYSREGQISSSYYINQRLAPRASSLTNVSFFPQDTPPNLPTVNPDPSMPSTPYWVGWTRNTNGGIYVDGNNFTLTYYGFYRAPVTGLYTLCTTADNENDVFWGHGNAFSCLDGRPDPNARPLVFSTGGNYINGIRCADVSLRQGEYYPLRNVMGNWQGPSAFNFTIKDPARNFDARTNDFTGLAYPHSCGLFGLFA